MMKLELKKIAYWGVIAVLSVMAAVSLFAGVRNGVLHRIDFQWIPTKILMEGENPYLYSLNHLPWREWSQIDANQIPSCLLLLAPWTLMDYPLANTVWAFCNVVFAFVFLAYCYKTFFSESAPLRLGNGFWMVALVFLSSLPLRVTIGNGQHLMFSLAFFMPAFYFALRGRQICAGILMALCFFKYTTVAPLLLVFVTMGAWRAIAVGAGLHILATLGVSFYLHESPVTLVVQSLQVGSMLTGQGLADIASLAKRLGCSWAGSLALPTYGIATLLALSVVIRGRKDLLLQLATFAVLSNVMFYHREYDFMSLFFVLMLAVRMVYAGEWKCCNDRLILLGTCMESLYMFYGFKMAKIPEYIVLMEHSLLVMLLWKVMEVDCCRCGNVKSSCNLAEY